MKEKKHLLIEVLKSNLKRSKMRNQSLKIIKEISKANKLWKSDYLEDIVRRSFFAVKEIMFTLEPELAIAYLSDKVYEKQKRQLYWNNINYERKIIRNLKITSIAPLSVVEEQWGKEGKIIFRIDATAMEYIVKESYNEENIVEINKGERVHITEYWTYKLYEENWLVDDIFILDKEFDDFEVKSESLSIEKI